ncbi:CsxC family protein [Maledivibacter halophilus]|uniref:DUF7852 domain-containing protein n=1 Tax=Maledivibacter halophilus TaxID=36842 RepID=A0A1T5MM88_9FIRM|nr:hypothetical protein [Maledivibacter halophilus]SKC88979.1 hypothetical protein SAMN02194393_04960 [Maledivibacter halophilus]
MANETTNQVANVTVTNGNNCGDSSFCADVFANTLEGCVNTPVDLDPITTGAVVKVPVVLAELNVQINVSSFINLPEFAIEIKNIKKRVKITQCRLLQDTNILFIKGFVRKNIDYATAACADSESVCGDIRHCTVDVPFECSTPVTFNGIDPAPLQTNTTEEFEYFRTQELPSGFPEKEDLLAGDLSEYNQISTEFFNEMPFCELISSRIVEFDEYLNRLEFSPAPFEERLFSKIEEKMVIFLTLKILQKRQVQIDAI